jgi:hypothetical protein
MVSPQDGTMIITLLVIGSKLEKPVNQKFLLNVFPIVFPENVNLRYQIWTVDPVPTTPILREKMRDDLRWNILRCPVGRIYHQEQFAFAVADTNKNKAISYEGGEKLYTITPSNIFKNIDLSNPSDGEIDLVTDMLFQAYNSHLGNDKSLAKGYASGTFYSITPDSPFNPKQTGSTNSSKSNASIYRGFSIRVGYFGKSGFCVGLDVQTSYIGSKPYSDFLKSSSSLDDVDIEDEVTRWVINYGSSMQSVYLVNRQNKPLNAVLFPNGTNAYEYIVSKYPSVKTLISPQDEAVSVIYKLSDKKNEKNHYSAASTLLYPKLKLGSRDVNALGDKPAFPADNRYLRIKGFSNRLSNMQFLGQTIKVGQSIETSADMFDAPSLVFGNGNVLNLNTLGKDIYTTQKEWGAKKLEFLEKYGPEFKKPFVKPFVVFPAKLEQDNLIDGFIKQTQILCKKFGYIDFEPEYSAYNDKASADEIIRKLKGIVEHQQCGFILFALPSDSKVANQVYIALKTEISIPSKCFSSSTFRQKHLRGQVDSYIQFNTLSMLGENDTRLWGIEGGLNYELHIGLDVARNDNASLMGATTLSNKTANNLNFFQKKLPANDDRSLKEQIPTATLGSFVLDRLKEFYTTYNRIPRNILFHRDGRAYDSEIDGIEKAIKKFLAESEINEELSWTLISLFKSNSMSLRLFASLNGKISSPFTGSYFVQNKTKAFIVTSGAPNLPQGTPKPIQVEIVSGNGSKSHELKDILRDVYWLTHLNWASPRITTSLPATIRYTDEKLERYILEGNDEDEDWS